MDYNAERGRMMTSLRVFTAICAMFVWVETCCADCSSLRALAQQHANDMARRNSLDHAGFMQHRGPAGAVAENVAIGRRYWAMLIGGSSSARVRHARVIRVRVSRRGSGQDGVVGRDMSIDPYR
jgi:hypothetical protein